MPRLLGTIPRVAVSLHVEGACKPMVILPGGTCASHARG